MEVIESKINLIHWITEINDPILIQKLVLFKEAESDFWDDLTDYEKMSIEEGLEDIDNNRVVPQSEIQNILDKWK